jgi:hypothetical protein
MKNVIYFVALATLPMCAAAQSTYVPKAEKQEDDFIVWAKKNVHGGLQLGGNALVPTNDLKGTKFLPGVTAGAFVDISLNSWLGWRADVQYNNRLWQTTQTSSVAVMSGGTIQTFNNAVTLLQNQKYIEVPMGFYCKISKDLRLGLGAQVQKLMDAKAEGERTLQQIQTNADGTTTTSQDALQKLAFDYLKDADGTGAYANNPAAFTSGKIDGQSFYKDLNFAAKVGIGFRLMKHIRIEAHTLYDLSSMLNDAYTTQNTPNSVAIDRSKLQQLNVQLGLSYQF